MGEAGVRKPVSNRTLTILHPWLLALVSVVVFLPLLRYWIENPVVFNYRLLSRMSPGEGGYPEPAFLIFLKNVWGGLVMPIWSSGNAWVTTIPNQPSLDLVSGAMYVLGIGLLILRYVLKRHWLDLALLLDLAKRSDLAGIQEWLSFYFKSPVVPDGLYAEHDLFIQQTKLKNTLRWMMGEDQITHLGREYYDDV